MKMQKTTILLVDDHEVVRIGLSSLLRRYEQFEILGEAWGVEDAIAKARELKPDVIILDVRLPDGSGVDVCKAVKDSLPGTKVIILTSYPDDEAVLASIMAGADGYVLKEVGSQALAKAIENVAAGNSMLDPAVTRTVMERMKESTRADEGPVTLLTDQEKKILSLLGKGKTNKEIAKEIFLSEKTVRNYVSNILTKLNLSNRAQAAAYAVRNNLVD